MIDSVTGVVLAGGKSTRMGTNKALLSYRGKCLIEAVIEILSSLFSRVILSVHHPDALSNLQLPKIVDRYPEIGPLGGITSTLESGETRIFCAACDMPFLNRSLIEHICSYTDARAVIPVWRGKAQVLHALYSNSCIPDFFHAIENKQYRITDAVPKEDVRFIHDEEIGLFDPQGESFENINTPAEYAKIQE